MAITRSQIARQLLEEGGLSSRLEEERDLSNPLVGRVLGPLGEAIKREGPGLLKDVAALVATGGLSKADAARRVIGSRLLGSVTRPVVQRVIRGESEPQPPTNFGSVTSQGEYVPPSALVSITDDSGAPTGFSEYSSPEVAASYEGSFAEGGDVSVKDAEKMAPKGEFLAYINDDEAALLKSLGGAGKAVNETGIPSFFAEKLFKKAKKTVKKVVKSPIGKAAIAIGLGAYAGGLGPFAKGSTMFGGKLAGIKGAGFAQGLFPSVMDYSTPTRTFFTELGKIGSKGISKFPGGGAGLTIAALSGASALMTPKQEEEQLSKLIADKTGIDVATIRKEVQDAYAAGDISGLKTKYPFLGEIRTIAAEGGIMKMASAPDPAADRRDMLEELSLKYYKKPLKDLTPDEFFDLENAVDEMSKKQGIERATAAEGGMMDLGGNEMDLRGGGFVPIGKEEKADDVPARLSKNEFVFTADAVRAAGGGSVDKGADLMYKTMKQLENKVA